jgi:acetyl esterase/lipase
MDVYYPSHARIAPLPAIVFVSGYRDDGFLKTLGCRFKEMASSTSWARLMAASGIIAVTYANREPAADVHALLRYIRRNAESLGIDANRIGVWASSGHVPLALSALMDDPGLKCAILCYGYTLDLDGATGVADAARQWGFANPCTGRTVADLPPNVPMFIARAGADAMPRLNEALDRFVAEALARNLPITLVNEPAAPHAFDLLQDNEASREIVRRVLMFAQFTLAQG